MRKTNRQFARTQQSAFTLVEMLVVISIVVILSAIIVPMLGVMSDLIRGGTGVNTINAAVTAARGYSTRQIDNNALVAGARYSGVAVVFCPSGEVRLVENIQTAQSTGGNFLETSGVNGYADISGRDYLTLPNDTGVVGIARNNTGLLMYNAPFAIRFDEFGHLQAGIASGTSRVVYYDGNPEADALFRINGGSGTGYDRNNIYGGGTYNVDEWDARADGFDASKAGPDAGTGSYYLPFEEIETVPGLIVYSRENFRDDGGAWPSTTPTRGCGTDGTSGCSDISEWMVTNGQSLFFSRYTGVVLREKSQ